jgi:hypothetical protein
METEVLWRTHSFHCLLLFSVLLAVVPAAMATSQPVAVKGTRREESQAPRPPNVNVGCPISPGATGQIPFTLPSGSFALPAWDLPSTTPRDPSTWWVLNCTWFVQCPMGTVFSVSNLSIPTFLSWEGGVSFTNVDTRIQYGAVDGRISPNRALLFNGTNVLVTFGTETLTGAGFSVSYQCLPVRCTTNTTAGTVNCTTTLSCPSQSQAIFPLSNSFLPSGKPTMASILQLRVDGGLGLEYKNNDRILPANGLGDAYSVTASFISNLVGVADLMFQYTCAKSKCGSPNISGSVYTQTTGSITSADPML